MDYEGMGIDDDDDDDDDASRGLQKKRRFVFMLRNVVVSLDLEEMSVVVLSKNGRKGSCGEGKGKWCVLMLMVVSTKGKRGEKDLVVADHK